MHTHRFNNYPVYICNAMNGMGSNPQPWAGLGGKRDAALIVDSPYEIVLEVWKTLKEKRRCPVTVDVSGPWMQPARHYVWLTVGVGEGEEFRSYRYRFDLLSGQTRDARWVGTEFIEMLKANLDAKITTKKQIHETGHHAWILELRSPQRQG